MGETCVGSLGWEDPLKKGKAIHSSILAWTVPWTVYPWGHKEWDKTEQLLLSLSLCLGFSEIQVSPLWMGRVGSELWESQRLEGQAPVPLLLSPHYLWARAPVHPTVGVVLSSLSFCILWSQGLCCCGLRAWTSDTISAGLSDLPLLIYRYLEFSCLLLCRVKAPLLSCGHFTVCILKVRDKGRFFTLLCFWPLSFSLHSFFFFYCHHKFSFSIMSYCLEPYSI